jgi:exodeoxyribonuclease-3
VKIISWNLNGIRAVKKKGLDESIQAMDPDVICFQETKAHPEDVEATIESIKGYHAYNYSAEKKGYSGTLILSRNKPIEVKKGMGVNKHDTEGRVLTAEYPDFFLVTAYVPNSGRGLTRLDYRQLWDKAFSTYLKNLQKTKPVILCGDLNVAHEPIDLANPKSNFNKTAGYTQQEIDGFKRLQKIGLIDTFRHKFPEQVAYTYWNYMFNARARNVGWRIDYFLVSKVFLSNVEDAFTLPDIMGSDHCPIGITLK